MKLFLTIPKFDIIFVAGTASKLTVSKGQCLCPEHMT